MGGWLLRRVVITIPVLIAITVLTFGMINLAPGDPILLMIDPTAAANDPGFLDRERARLGLDRPVPVRYVVWLGEVLRGNLGFSPITHRPVLAMVSERIGPTLELMGSATLIAIIVGILLGILSAVRQYSFIDYLATGLGFATVSIPGFFLALGAIYILAVKLDLLPTAGMATIGDTPSVADHLRHLILPMMILALGHVPIIMRYVRSGMLEVLRQDYVTTARAKGLRSSVVLTRHALRNALIPLVTILALDVPRLFSGAIVIEQIFAWPGMGTLAISAISQRDYQVLMGFNLLIATFVVFGNLLADTAYALIDPRIRYR